MKFEIPLSIAQVCNFCPKLSFLSERKKVDIFDKKKKVGFEGEESEDEKDKGTIILLLL